MTRIVKKPEERRREIIETARQLFQQKGVEKSTLQDVMVALNIAKGTIYHYFKSKEELLEAVVENLVDEYLTDLNSVLDRTPGNALERIQALVAAGNVEEQNREVLDALHRPENIGLHTRQLALLLSGLSPLYASVIQQGCDEGLFHTDSPLECAEFLLAGIQFLTDVGFHPWTPEQLARRSQALPALVEALLGAPKGSFNFLSKQ